MQLPGKALPRDVPQRKRLRLAGTHRVERRKARRNGAPLWLFLFLLVCATVAPLVGSSLFLANNFAQLERARNLERVQEKAHTMALAIDRDIARNADMASIWPARAAAARIAEAYDLPEGWFAAVIDEQFTIRARSHRAEDFIGTKASSSFVQTLEQEVGIAETVDLEGRPSVTAFSRSPHTRWAAVVWVPRAVLDAPSRQLSQAVLAISALGLLLSVAAGLLAANLISRPTRRAVEAARRLAEGLVPPVSPTGLREIDLLSGSLHRAGVEITARERALKNSTERANRIIESIMDGFMVLDSAWRITFLSPRGHEILRQAPQELYGKSLWDAFPELVGSPFEEAYRRAVSERTMVCLEGFYPPLDSWFDVRAYPSPEGLSVLFLDITERKRAEARQRLLMRELDHRAKNVLAVVQSVVNLTKADTIEDFIAAVRGRVAALARTHTLLAENRWEGADLATLIEDELEPYRDGTARISVSGPAIDVAPEHVQSLGMIVHELATNAVKYGALSVAEGRVEIRWELLGSRDLRISWRELGGPPVEAPVRYGFGSKMIRRTIESQLHGTVLYNWLAEGLLCEFRMDGAFLTTRIAPHA